MRRPCDIAVIFGDDGRRLARELLNELRPGTDWPRDAEIALKPNLILAKSAASGATTHPEVVAGVIEYLQDEGFRRICIMEGSWVGDRTARALEVCGFRALSRRYGVELVDLQTDAAEDRLVDGVRLRVCRRVLQTGRLINLPVLKGHCQTRLTCALKNLKGCIPDSEKRRYHELGVHRPVALLNTVIRPAFTLVDGLCGDPGFEEGGEPAPGRRLLAGWDPVLLDVYAAGLLGLAPDDVPYIGMAAALGVGRADLSAARVRYLNRGEGVCTHIEREAAKPYRGCIQEEAACSACFGSLVGALRCLEAARAIPDGLRFAIGQGFRGRDGTALGIGDCTRGFAAHVPGCPPRLADIVAAVREAGGHAPRGAGGVPRGHGDG